MRVCLVQRCLSLGLDIRNLKTNKYSKLVNILEKCSQILLIYYTDDQIQSVRKYNVNINTQNYKITWKNYKITWKKRQQSLWEFILHGTKTTAFLQFWTTCSVPTSFDCLLRLWWVHCRNALIRIRYMFGHGAWPLSMKGNSPNSNFHHYTI